MSATVRLPAVAGTFYPDEPRALAATVDDLLARARAWDGPAPKAIVAPHAGYVYSGAVAASVYAALTRARATIRRVVLVGPAHRVPVEGVVVPSVDAFRTPLGDVPVDVEERERLLALADVSVDDAAHAPEHSLEVHLPFLQRLLDEFTVLPLVVGHARPAVVADVLDAVWGGPETLVVVSSDLSHYESYDVAAEHDRRTAAAIVAGDLTSLDPHDACGAHPVRGLLVSAGRHRLRVELVDLRSSGDTAGTRDRVVGYGSFALVPDDDADEHGTAGDEPRAARTVAVARPVHPVHPVGAGSPGAVVEPDGAVLLDVADATLRDALATGRRVLPDARSARFSPTLLQPAATFVTLLRGDALLGCIGTLEPQRPLVVDVAANALAAAFEDPRLPPLRGSDLPDTTIKVSILSEPEPCSVASTGELLATLRPGVDGVVVEDPGHRATFLPSVWSQLPDPSDFCAHLWRKAGLVPGAWPDGIRLARYTVAELTSPAPRPPL